MASGSNLIMTDQLRQLWLAYRDWHHNFRELNSAFGDESCRLVGNSLLQRHPLKRGILISTAAKRNDSGQQFPDRNTQGLCDLLDVVDRNVPTTHFNMRNERPMQIRLQSQVFLRPASFGTDALHVRRKNFSGVFPGIGGSHGTRMVPLCCFCVSRVYVTMPPLFATK